ncbi:MAG: hypothetical protein WKF37_03815 [Bryobacteraceae bacterium]
MLTGTNLTDETRVLFDGIQASNRSIDPGSGRLTVTVPSAPAGHRANVVALNSDGQSSLFGQSEVPGYTFGGSESSSATALSASPGSLTAGSEAALQIDGLNTSFAGDATVVGLGSSDIAIRRVWVVSPTRLIVNVAVSPYAQTGGTHLTVVSGLQLYSQPFGLTILNPPSRPFWLNSNVTNAATGYTSLTAGSIALVNVGASPAALNPAALSAFLGETRVGIVSVAGTQVLVQIPQGIPVGPMLLRLELAGEKSSPIALQIDSPAPRIVSATTGDQAVSGARPLRAGDTLTLTMANLDSPGVAISPSRLAIQIGGLELKAAQVVELNGLHRVVVAIPANVPAGALVPLRVTIDDRQSELLQIATN